MFKLHFEVLVLLKTFVVGSVVEYIVSQHHLASLIPDAESEKPILKFIPVLFQS